MSYIDYTTSEWRKLRILIFYSTSFSHLNQASRIVTDFIICGKFQILVSSLSLMNFPTSSSTIVKKISMNFHPFFCVCISLLRRSMICSINYLLKKPCGIYYKHVFSIINVLIFNTTITETKKNVGFGFSKKFEMMFNL